jgi:hypothetical protein
MVKQRITAIPIDDKTLAKPLEEISGAQLLEILSRGDAADRTALALLPDKKKYELWVEEGGVGRIPVGELLHKLRGEKKKLELEKQLGEQTFDPGRGAIDPRVIDAIADRVAERLGR